MTKQITKTTDYIIDILENNIKDIHIRLNKSNCTLKQDTLNKSIDELTKHIETIRQMEQDSKSLIRLKDILK